MTSKLDEELGRLLNAPMEFKYIEDPEIIALLREIGARWPEIASAADHPLLEYFIQRQGRPGVIMPLVRQLRKLPLLFLLALPFLIQPFISFLTPITMRYNLILVWTVIFVIVLGFPNLILFYIRRKRYARFPGIPENLILSDREKNCWIWLTGLSPTELSAIVFAFHYWGAKELVRIRPVLYLIWLAIAATIIRHSTGMGAQNRMIVTAVEVFPFAILYTYYLTDKCLIAHQSLWKLDFLIRRRNHLHDYGANNALLISMVIFGEMFVSFYFARIPILMLVLFGILQLHDRLGKKIDETFKEIGKSEREFANMLVPEYAKGALLKD